MIFLGEQNSNWHLLSYVTSYGWVHFLPQRALSSTHLFLYVPLWYPSLVSGRSSLDYYLLHNILLAFHYNENNAEIYFLRERSWVSWITPAMGPSFSSYTASDILSTWPFCVTGAICTSPKRMCCDHKSHAILPSLNRERKTHICILCTDLYLIGKTKYPCMITSTTYKTEN